MRRAIELAANVPEFPFGALAEVKALEAGAVVYGHGCPLFLSLQMGFHEPEALVESS